MKLKDTCSLESCDKPRQHIKNQRHWIADKVLYSQNYVFFFFFPVATWMGELDHKEGWAPKYWFQIVVLEKSFKSPLDCKEIKLVNPKGNQPWLYIARTDAEPEAPILWPPDVKSQLIGKDSDAGKDWRQNRRGRQRMRWLESIPDSMDMNLSKFWETVEDRGDWCAAVHGVRHSNWTTIRFLVTSTNWASLCLSW